MKSNACLSFKVNSTLARTLKLKLNPLLIAYTKGFIIVIKVYKSSAIISANRKLNL
jgi:hypothetical protein